MIPHFGPLELVIILVIVIMLFGVGKLPEVFGSVGRGIREFLRASSDPEAKEVAPVAETEVAEPPVVQREVVRTEVVTTEDRVHEDGAQPVDRRTS
jgi:sec-independent protein translocase protein TatA